MTNIVELGTTIKSPSTRNGVSNLERLLIRSKVISGSFMGLDNQKFTNVHNYRRLLLIALITVMTARFVSFAILNDVWYDQYALFV